MPWSLGADDIDMSIVAVESVSTVRRRVGKKMIVGEEDGLSMVDCRRLTCLGTQLLSFLSATRIGPRHHLIDGPSTVLLALFP